MTPRKRILLLTLIMSLIVLVVQVITINTLYKTAMKEETLRLKETSKSQARLIEAVARYDKLYSTNYPHGARQATLSQIKDAHSKYRGFGKTGNSPSQQKKTIKLSFY